MNKETAPRLLGRQVAIEVASEASDATIGQSTLVRTGRFHEIDRADNGDMIP